MAGFYDSGDETPSSAMENLYQVNTKNDPVPFD